ncbi:MAG TPA: Flp pilus assembly protein CpaB [Myxococcales bacterium]|nr:Flp pilus assembly protein CpaB [Myxococcales bacterium]
MNKGRTPLLIAIILGVGAALLGYLDRRNAERNARKGWDLVPIVVAAQDVDEGTVLTTDMIAQQPMPSRFVTPSVIKPENYSYVVGQKVLVNLHKHDPLLWTQFESSKGLERLSKAIQKNFRAVTISASDNDGVGGWIRPNDHVDILATFKDPQSSETDTMTLLENVLVLATGRITGNTNMNLLSVNDRRYDNVTVLLLPEEAEILSLAREIGRVSLTLRNEDDLETQGERLRTTPQTLLTQERLKVLEQKRHKQEISIINGAH